MTADLGAIRARLAAASVKWGHVRAPVGARNASAAQRAADADLIAHAPADLAALCDEVESLRAAVERVRALHAAYYPLRDGRAYCGACEGDELVAWPCPTLRALDGAE